MSPSAGHSVCVSTSIVPVPQLSRTALKQTGSREFPLSARAVQRLASSASLPLWCISSSPERAHTKTRELENRTEERMVKISFQPVSVQKPEKQRDGGKEEIIMSYSQTDDLVLPVRPKKSSVNYLWCLIPGLVIFVSGLIMLSVYVYRYYVNTQIPEDSLFHCRVMYEDSLYAPLLGRQELQENVGIYLEENYEHISVPVPNFGGSDPADIVHDFHRGLTAYHDIALDKCYVVELNTTVVMPPRNLWELLINVKRGVYLPQTYMVQEEMMVTGRVKNMRQLGPFIHRLCYGKETFRLKRRNSRRRIEKRDTRKCRSIRHFENTFVMETVICDRA